MDDVYVVYVPFDKLPKEMLLLILSFIPKNKLYQVNVNRQFEDAILDILGPIVLKNVNTLITCEKIRHTIELKALARALEKNKTLKIIDFCGQSLQYKGFNIFAKALKLNKTLLKICLDSNDIGDDGAILLAQVLEQNTSMEEKDSEESVE